MDIKEIIDPNKSYLINFEDLQNKLDIYENVPGIKIIDYITCRWSELQTCFNIHNEYHYQFLCGKNEHTLIVFDN